MRITTRVKTFLFKNKLLVLVVALAFSLRFLGLMPNILHADEGHVEDKSWDLVLNVLEKRDFNPHSFKYGTLMFYSQALGAFPILIVNYLKEVANIAVSSTFTSRSLDFNLFFNEAVRKYGVSLITIGRAETAFFGGVSVIILYFIGKKLFNKRVGLLSALILSITPLHVRDSHYITTDILATLSVLVAFLCLVYLIEKKSWKWFILSGITLGLSTTVRYYPIAFLAYPIAVIFSFEKKRIWLFKVIASFLFIFVGLFIGLPFLFLDPSGPALLMQDLVKYALPWYGTSLSTYIFSVASSIFSGGKSSMPNIEMLYKAPQSFRPVHASWIFFNAFGIMPTITAFLGVAISLFKSPKKFLLLLSIPVFNFVYISSFIPATYERLIIPMLPFMAIFVGIFLDRFYLFTKNKWSIVKAKFVFIFVLLTIIILPFYISLSSSFACSQPTIQNQSYDWVARNIPDDIKAGYLTMVTVPPKPFKVWAAIEPNQKLSLEESRQLNIDYAFINAARLDYNTYQYFNSFFIPPERIYENSYYFLVLSEYQSRGKFLGKVRKPWMCDVGRIYYYRLPEILHESVKKFANFAFDDQNDLKSWELSNNDPTGQSSLSFNDKLGKGKKGSLEYSQSAYTFTAPRIISTKIGVNGKKVFTLSFWIRSDSENKVNQSTVVGRVDFYNKGIESLMDKARKLFLLVVNGPTPMYFEKKREIKHVFNDIFMPGESVALSSLTRLNDKWQKIVITSSAPSDSDSVVFSIQPVSTDATKLYIDDVTISGE